MITRSTILPSYTHLVDPKLKHTYLSFDDSGALVIKSPKVSSQYLEALLIKKAGWIKKTQARLKQKKGRVDEIHEGMPLYYLGESYPLKMLQHSTKKTHLSFEETHFALRYHTFSPEILHQAIDRYYKERAQTYIPSLVETWSKKMGLDYGSIRFRKTKRQWGSCSSRNNLNFNTMLMKLPVECIEYVVVHELAHIQHKHHQKTFWALVEKHMSDFKSRQAILKTYTPL